jgi:hypothetical protein
MALALGSSTFLDSTNRCTVYPNRCSYHFYGDKMSETNETISLIGTTLDGVLITKTISEEDGLTLVELAEAIKVFVKAFGYDYIEDVVFETNLSSHGSSGSTYNFEV